MNYLLPNWPSNTKIKAYTSLRSNNGLSCENYSNFNLSTYVGDSIEIVEKNRGILKEELDLPSEPFWLKQVHGIKILNLVEPLLRESSSNIEADGTYTNQPKQVCVVQTADCLPVLICNKQGTEVSAVHAGWRGLFAGIIKSAIDCFQSKRDDILVWLGPAIGPEAFEVGLDVYEAFIKKNVNNKAAFKNKGENKWLADIYTLAKIELNNMEIFNIYGGKYCTYSNSELFYSFRRDNVTGRMASLIWID